MTDVFYCVLGLPNRGFVLFCSKLYFTLHTFGHFRERERERESRGTPLLRTAHTTTTGKKFYGQGFSLLLSFSSRWLLSLAFTRSLHTTLLYAHTHARTQYTLGDPGRMDGQLHFVSRSLQHTLGVTCHRAAECSECVC